MGTGREQWLRNKSSDRGKRCIKIKLIEDPTAGQLSHAVFFIFLRYLGVKKEIFNLLNSKWLRRLLRLHQTVIHLLTSPENVTTLSYELQNFFIWLKVCCVPSNVGGSEKSQLWVVVGGSEKNRLWCVATGMSHYVRQALSQQVFRVITFCISRIVHQHVMKFSRCRNKPLPQRCTDWRTIHRLLAN